LFFAFTFVDGVCLHAVYSVACEVDISWIAWG